MIEAVAPQDFIATFAACALIVLFGAGYAGLFAWSRVRRRRDALIAAGIFYAALVLTVMLLSRLAHLDGSWQAVTGLMLVGYLLAPWAIWKLCAASHGGNHEDQ